MDVFNVTNGHTVLTETQALGTSGLATQTTNGVAGPNLLGFVGTFRDGGPGGSPQTMLAPRILRLSVQVKF